MSGVTVFEVEVPASTLALGATFERAPEIQFEMERLVGGSDDRVMPFVWVSGVEAWRAAELLENDPTVTAVERLSSGDEATLFEITFDGGIRSFAETIFDRGGVVLQADGEDGVWSFELRFGDRTDVGSVFDDDFCREYGATVTRLYSDHQTASNGVGLTPKQRQALMAAHEMGYYSVPRSVDLRAVGEKLGVSRQAVSERLRRAHDALVEDHFRGAQNR
ncbi:MULTISPECIES: bacterio-opsin activator domain-containing protein [Halorussus]|uniref:bacterio-opsin activator domain-containing protein n=1 Tax=Halorussus TaxID=1070314 RepID=UPI00209F6221|nr:bacterio-opsin activator domain-containing protein [Halorussus vallis]USZ77070.1 helix-turn-helix domain-containing protein [Halorussus vallis]